ncbi:DUF417 family protein [Pseudomonas sp. NPDC007930]|uniref:YkgB family protein n=1 Tax=Pseudomonas sp. NPDC007930 TaxID=3364417 RepID=UPI0036E11CE4
MEQTPHTPCPRQQALDAWVGRHSGARAMRAVLVLIFLGFGYTKWFDYEVQALVPLIANSPLLSWMYALWGHAGGSYALGVAEWGIAALLLLGLVWPVVGVVGAAGSMLTYSVTLSLILTTPGGWEASAGGFPAMGDSTGFLLKDAVLLVGSWVVLRADWLRWRARA